MKEDHMTDHPHDNPAGYTPVQPQAPGEIVQQFAIVARIRPNPLGGPPETTLEYIFDPETTSVDDCIALALAGARWAHQQRIIGDAMAARANRVIRPGN